MAEPQATLNVVTAYPSAIDDAAMQKMAMNEALERRDSSALVDHAKAVGIDSSMGRVLLSTAQEINSRKKEFQDITRPIAEAKSDGERNIASAKAIQNYVHEPMYGQALVAFMLGQKEDAFQLFTGGKPKTTVEYAKDNGNIIQVTTNALGKPLSYYDTKLGRQLTPEEYSDRGGSVSEIDRTLKMKTMEENRSAFNAAYQKEKTGLNKFATAYAAYAPKIEFVDQAFGRLKTDIPAEEYAKLIGAVSNSFGQASSKNNASTLLNQIQKNASSSEGQRIDESIAATLGLPKESIGKIMRFDATGSRLVSTDGKFSTSADRLKQQTDSASIASEATKNTQTTLESVLTSEKFKAAIAGKSKDEQARIIQEIKTAMQFANEVGADFADLSSKYERPAFISLPTAASFVDNQAQLKVQMSQHKQNIQQLAAAVEHYKKSDDAFTRTGMAPAPGEVGRSFTTTDIYRQVRQNWANQIQQDVAADYQAREARKQQQTERPKPKQDSTKAVAPPKKAPTLAELAKQAGGK
jgi:hypothetical protein